MIFVDPVTTLLALVAVLGVQLVARGLRLPARPGAVPPALMLPLQQLAYRQLMYLVLIHSWITAAGGRLRWQKLRRVGGLEDLLPAAPEPGTTEIPRERLVVLSRR